VSSPAGALPVTLATYHWFDTTRSGWVLPPDGLSPPPSPTQTLLSEESLEELDKSLGDPWINVAFDIFARPDIGALAKFLWLLLILFIPIIGMLIYFIARPDEFLVE
jgi:hypothetical protein